MSSTRLKRSVLKHGRREQRRHGLHRLHRFACSAVRRGHTLAAQWARGRHSYAGRSRRALHLSRALTHLGEQRRQLRAQEQQRGGQIAGADGRLARSERTRQRCAQHFRLSCRVPLPAPHRAPPRAQSRFCGGVEMLMTADEAPPAARGSPTVAAKRRLGLSYDSVATPRPPSSTMLASFVLPSTVAPRAARAALARPRRVAPAASRPLRHVARAAASGYVNPLRPGETEAQAAERRQRESDRISERTKVRTPHRCALPCRWRRQASLRCARMHRRAHRGPALQAAFASPSPIATAF